MVSYIVFCLGYICLYFHLKLQVLLILLLFFDRWWRSWSAFVNQDPTTNSSSSILQRPLSIDNSDLICGVQSDNSTNDIHDSLVEGTHYILVTENIWNQLYEWLVCTCMVIFFSIVNGNFDPFLRNGPVGLFFNLNFVKCVK